MRSAFDRAEARAGAAGKKLTGMRRAVLEIICRSHEPVGAYDILKVLGGHGTVVQPPTVYRALAFLTKLGLVHRLETLNAYVGCAAGEAVGDLTEFYICRACNRVTETASRGITRSVADQAAAMAFTIERQIIEIIGLCPDCSGSADQG